VDTREASGQMCSAGYTQTSIFMTVDYGGGNICNYTILMCYKCGVTGANPHNFQVKGIFSSTFGCSVPTSGPDFDVFVAKLEEEIFIKWVRMCSIPPCPSSTRLEIYRIPTCWRLKYNQSLQNFGVIACDEIDSFCIKSQYLCMNYDTTPPSLMILSESWSKEGTMECEDTIPQPPLMPEDGWESDCFEFYKTCN